MNAWDELPSKSQPYAEDEDEEGVGENGDEDVDEAEEIVGEQGGDVLMETDEDDEDDEDDASEGDVGNDVEAGLKGEVERGHREHHCSLSDEGACSVQRCTVEMNLKPHVNIDISFYDVSWWLKRLG